MDDLTLLLLWVLLLGVASASGCVIEIVWERWS